MTRKPRWPKLNLPALAAAMVLYAALHLLFTALPHTLTFSAGYLDLRPGVVIPLAAGLLAGPGAGALVGGLGRLGGDLLSGNGLDGPGLVYSLLLGLIAGFGYRRQANRRTLAALGWALGWGLLATTLAALVVTLGLEALLLARYPLAGAWQRTVSETLSGGLAVLLLMPGVLVAVSLKK